MIRRRPMKTMRGEHPALAGAAMPGWFGAQFSLGISA